MAFFEEIGKKISDVGQGVTQQTKNWTELGRLSNMAKEKDDEITKVYVAIGYAYYNRHKDDADAEEIENIQKLKSLFEELGKINGEIKKLKGYRSCPSCSADVAPEAMFCASCGANVPPAGADAQQNTANGAASVSFCPNCGNQIKAGSMFCNNCGTKVG